MDFPPANYLELSELLKSKKPDSLEFRALMGFDGFIDNVVRIRQDRRSGEMGQTMVGSPRHSLGEFARFLSSKDGLSFSLELEAREERMGGNMPITANALGKLGVEVHCIGAMGRPGAVDPSFQAMSPRCVLYPVTEPGWSVAFEFSDSKLMVYDNRDIESLDWSLVRSTIGLPRLIDLFERSRLIGLFNWSEVRGSQDIWSGLIHDVLPRLSHPSARSLFVDLSDCGGRQPEEILAAISQMGQLSASMPMTLSMNENEILRIHGILAGGEGKGSAGADGAGERRTETYFTMLSDVRTALPGSTIVLHLAGSSLAIAGDGGRFLVRNLHIADPMILIGGGDNYNAGFCLGLLLGESVVNCMALAGAVASHYVQHGRSPDLGELAPYLVGIWKSLQGGEGNELD